MPLDHQPTAEPHNFADKALVLVAVRDHDGVDALIDGASRFTVAMLRNESISATFPFAVHRRCDAPD